MNNGTLVGCTTTESWSREDVENAHYVVLCRNVWTVENTTNGHIHNGVTKHICDPAEKSNVQDIKIEDERSHQVETEDSKNKAKHEEDSIIDVEDRMTDAEKQMAKNEPSGKDEGLQKDRDDKV
jgi:predicted ATPase